MRLPGEVRPHGGDAAVADRDFAGGARAGDGIEDLAAENEVEGRLGGGRVSHFLAVSDPRSNPLPSRAVARQDFRPDTANLRTV